MSTGHPTVGGYDGPCDHSLNVCFLEVSQRQQMARKCCCPRASLAKAQVFGGLPMKGNRVTWVVQPIERQSAFVPD